MDDFVKRRDFKTFEKPTSFTVWSPNCQSWLLIEILGTNENTQNTHIDIPIINRYKTTKKCIESYKKPNTPNK